MSTINRSGFSMRGVSAVVLSAVLFLVGLTMAGPQGRSSSDAIRAEAVFSPGGGCESRIVEQIESAEKSVLVQIHFFTSKPICDALVKAKKRGAVVKVILDKSQEKMAFGRWPILRRGGVEVFFDRQHDTANNKIILIDDRTVITGSYNFTKAAEESNAENVIIVEGHEELFGKYKANFDAHLAHANKP